MKSATPFSCLLFALCLPGPPLAAQGAEEGAAPPPDESVDAVWAEIDQTLAEIDRLLELSESDLGGDASAAASPPPPLVPSRLAWNLGTHLSVGVDDNVLLDNAVPVESGFLRTGVDLSADYRLSRSQALHFFSFYEGRVFAEDVPSENLAFAELEWSWSQEPWKLGLTAGMIFSEFVYDATTLSTSPERTSGLVREKRPSAELSLERILSPKWTLRGRLGWGESSFGATSDDYWSLRGTVELLWFPTRSIQLKSWFWVEEEIYRSALARSSYGLPLAEKLRLQSVRLGSTLHWRLAPRWSLYLPLWGEIERDPEGVYHDRARAYVQPRLSWSRGPWGVSLSGNFVWVAYTDRRVSFIDASAQWQHKWGGALELRRSLGDHWTIHLEGGYAALRSNLKTVEYRNWIAEAGVGYDF